MSEPRRPGRPQIADPDAIAKIAVALFAERGFESVTMDEVAIASGVSRRTLFRHFPSKATLVWHGFFVAFDEVSDAVAETPPAPGVEGIREIVRATIAFDDEEESIARVRLGIIASSPEVLAAGLEGLEDVRVRLTHHLARDGAMPIGSLDNAVVAVLVMNVILTAAMWWAGNSEERLIDVVDRALVRFGEGYA